LFPGEAGVSAQADISVAFISFCFIGHAVSCLTPSWHINSRAAMSFLAGHQMDRQESLGQRQFRRREDPYPP